jgi:hypothetical protein
MGKAAMPASGEAGFRRSEAGQTSLAIHDHKKSLELNPKNHGGAEMLKKLKGKD